MPVTVAVAEAPRRQLTLLDVLAIGVNATVGSGVFTLPDDMQRSMGAWSPFAYVLCALLLAPVALCFAELSGRYDETGGAYVYAREAFGDNVGFLIGWFCWTATFVSWAANSTLLVALLGVRSAFWIRVLPPLSIVILGAINYYGIKPGAWTVKLVVIGKISAILCFLGVALFAVDPTRFGGALPHGVRGVAGGVYLALFPLQGFEVAPVAAGETQNPRRNVPLATIGTLVLSALLFIVVQTVLVGSYPDLAADSRTPLVDAARHLGPRLGMIVFVGSMVSIGGFNAGSALGSPRYAQAIAARRLLPAPLARIHPRWASPHVAIIATTAVAAILASLFDYVQLVGMANITVVIQYLFACLAVPIIRRKAREGKAHKSGWVIPFGWLVPAVGAVASLVLLGEAGKDEVIFAGGALAVAFVVLFLHTRRPATA